jgi:6-phosphogluconolactonase
LNRFVKVFSSPFDLARDLAEEMILKICEAGKNQKPFNIVLSGGSTPELLYSLIGDNYSKSAPWKYVHFFWGDERCVPADHQDSNFGMTRKKLLEKIDIPFSNIHRIRGEMDPEKEAARYSREILSLTDNRDGMPLFDLILLGLGDDGHTASIFPENMELIVSDKICEVAVHPVSFQKRITLTGRVINNSVSVRFLVTGKRKAEIVEKIINNNPSAGNYPASLIIPLHGELIWHIDIEASGLL